MTNDYAMALLDKAKGLTGSDNATATAAGVTRQTLHAVRKGKAKLSPELGAIIAAAIGDDPDYAAKRIMLENAPPSMLARLQKAFRVAAGVAGVAVLAALTSAPYDAHAGTIKTDRDVRHVSGSLTDYTLSLFIEVADLASGAPVPRSRCRDSLHFLCGSSAPLRKCLPYKSFSPGLGSCFRGAPSMTSPCRSR